MPSLDLLQPVLDFLVTDVRTGVNAELADTLAAGSVAVSREPRGVSPRREKAHPTSVALVPGPAETPKEIGIGWVRRSVPVRLEAVAPGGAYGLGSGSR